MRSFNVIIGSILVGPAPTLSDITSLNISRVVSLTRAPVALPSNTEVLHRPFAYWDDDVPVETFAKIIEDTAELASDPARTLIHCRLGLDRCGIVAIAILMRLLGCSLSQAIKHYAEIRHARLPRPDALIFLWTYTASSEPKKIQ